MNTTYGSTPADLGYYFPAEWHMHEATWLSWPHNKASWPGKIESIYYNYARFVKEIAQGEKVRINVCDEAMKYNAISWLQMAGTDLSQVEFYMHPTNDAWCRDHGPAFLINTSVHPPQKAIVDWGYNAWGGKYPPYHLDDVIPTLIAKRFNLPVFYPNIIMEGGSVEFNGSGVVLTTTSCLLNKNRNPHLSQKEIESYLINYYGVNTVWWLDDGIAGDDTDGHIDDITRFVNTNTVVTVIESNPDDENYEPLQKNLHTLQTFRINGEKLNIITLPMPKPVYYNNTRLPASYANFYICNHAVIVPTYQDHDNDMLAIEILKSCFKDRAVVGIDSTDIIWGLGSFHCLSQQEPVCT
ncbi:MAG: agmatine deiminase family protein [Cytophagaceae bacterium]|nr:agmatine deiminase family protein [Cytophagaceae bacterium]MDW8457056.1 agmatine deiminase family protein [Cytophagaceae bacterium]